MPGQRHSQGEFQQHAIGLGKFDHDLTTTEPWESLVFIGKSSPCMAELFRLVNYCNLPRLVIFWQHIWGFHRWGTPIAGGFRGKSS